MSDLLQVKRRVEIILEENPATRESDDLLFLEVIRKAAPEAENLSVGCFLKHRKDLEVPSFESVRRSRQKIQAERPELKGNNESERRSLEADFRAFALGGYK